MTLQHWLMLALIAAAAAYLGRGLFRSACGSGCGSCGSKGCPSRAKAEDSRA